VIPYGKQDIDKSDIDAVIDILKSDFLTNGPTTPKFEEVLCKYTGANYAVAVNSATSALHIACLSLGLEKGDWLWTSPNSFVASANCGLYCGANIDFVDINPLTYNLSADKLEKKLILAEKHGILPKIVIPVHFAGQSCNMKKIHALSKQYGFSIIEDASHAIGGKYLNLTIGSCSYSDITVFSFHPVKIITTAEGGMATTNSEYLSNRMKLYRSHGITRDIQLMTKNDGPWCYQQIGLGYNYRMTDIQSALGISQMKRIDDFVINRHKAQKRYDLLLKDLPVITPYQDHNSFSSLHLYPIQIDIGNNKRKQVFNELRFNGIGVNVHYIPIYMHPHYNRFNYKYAYCPNSQDYYSKAISLPLFHTITIEQQEKIASTLKSILSQFKHT